MKSAFIVHGVRTAIGKFGGGLSSIRADDLCAAVIENLMKSCATVDKSDISEVIMGCANQAGEDNRNIARMSALLAGLPVSVPGITVNRLCASGLSAVADSARLIQCADASLVIAGGVEHMTRGPFVLGKASQPFGRDQSLQDSSFGWRFVNPKVKMPNSNIDKRQL
jgi:acetyl-CoA acyltransferase